MYSSKMAERDVGLGYGWGHTFGWEIEVGRRSVRVWNEQGIAVDFPVIPADGEVVGPWGWLLRRDGAGFALDADDGVSRLFSAADERGKCHRLTAIEDANGNRIALTHEKGRLVEIVDSAGRVIRVGAAPDGRIASIEVKNAVAQGQWVTFATYAYDDRGDLRAVRDADGFSARYAYDEEHRLTLDTDRTGLAFHFVYDREGRCVESWGDYPGKRDPSLAADLPTHLADGVTRAKGIHHCRFDYMPDGYSEVADSTQVRRFFGNAHGLLDKKVEGGAVVTATYDEHGHLLSRCEAGGAMTVYERDPRGRVLRMTDPLGRSTIYERDAAGQLEAQVDPGGGRTTYQRERVTRQLIVTDPAGAVTVDQRDSQGKLVSRTLPDGARYTYSYDRRGSLIRVTQPNGGAFTFQCDDLGRRIAQITPTGAERRYAHSSRGDLVAVRDESGGVTRYDRDGEGHLTRRTSPGGRVTELSWGGYHKLCARTDAGGGIVSFQYNLEGELVAIRNEHGEMHHMERSRSGQLVAETTFDARALQYRRDAAGRPLVIADGGESRVELEYNAAGELVSKRYADGSEETFEYDARGEIIGARWADGEVRFERDAVGRIIREIQVIHGQTHAVESTYDVMGNRASRTTSLGHSQAVERDLMGARVRTVLDGSVVIAHTRDLLGREVGRSLPLGGVIESTHDAMGRLERRRASSPTLVAPTTAGEPDWVGLRRDRVTAESAYQYTPDSEITASLDRALGTTRYERDAVGQLLAVLPERGSPERFRYDRTGNVHEADREGSRSYGPANVLEKRLEVSYRWDPRGRLIEKTIPREVGPVDTWRYEWNEADQVKSVTTPSGDLLEFIYDPFARRLLKRVSPRGRDGAVQTTRFVWDKDVLVHEVKTAADGRGDPVVLEKTYVWDDSDGEPLAHGDRSGQGPAVWYHYVNDVAGTPQRLLSGTGETVCELSRSAWGCTTIPPAAQTSTPLRFEGQYDDVETGLAYNRCRYYDPEIGRYISPDPIGVFGGANQYAYVADPFSETDPLGLASKKTPPVPDTEDEAVAKAKSAAGLAPDSKPYDTWEVGPDAKKRGDPNYVYNTNPSHAGTWELHLTPTGEERVIVKHTTDPDRKCHVHAGKPKGGAAAFADPKGGEERYQKIDKPGGDHHFDYGPDLPPPPKADASPKPPQPKKK
jgi:RHS repeat-associated protein